MINIATVWALYAITSHKQAQTDKLLYSLAIELKLMAPKATNLFSR